MGPPEGGAGAEEAREAKVVGVAVTLMGPAPLGKDIGKRMDFRVKSKYLNLEARRAMPTMWPAPSNSGPTVSPITMIIMRIHTSCRWWFRL